MQLTAKEVAIRLSPNGRINQTPGGYTTCCPAHDDRNASLNVGTGDNGKLVWRCYAGCEQLDVWKAMVAKIPELQRADMREDRTPAKPRVKPTPPVELTPAGIKWLVEERKISTDAIAQLQIGWDADRQGIAFPYYLGGELQHVKVRLRGKNWWQTPGGGKCYYNLDRIDPGQPIYIVEGEIDAASLVTVGFDNVVSVPNGAGLTEKSHPEYLAGSVEVFSKASQIILAVDGDEKGTKLRDALAGIYGKDKCWMVMWPDGCKDANDVLVQHGADALIRVLERATPFPIRALQRARDYFNAVFELYDNGKDRGLSTGYQLVDEYYTVMPGELEVVTGIPSSGKTNWLDQVCVNLTERYGTKHAVVSFENPMEQHLGILAEKRARRSFVGYGDVRISKAELEDALVWIDAHWVFVRFDDDTHPTIDAILEHARAAKIRHGIETLIIDPWNYIEQSRRKEQSETEYTSEVLSKLRIFAQNHNVHVWLVAHPPKLQRDKDGQINPPTGYDISGSAHFYNKADVLTVVHRNATVSPQEVDIIWRKVRFKMTGKPGQLRMKYNLATGCYEEPRY